MGKPDDGLLAIADALNRLDNADATTPLGGLEALGLVFKQELVGITLALDDIASALREIADAIKEREDK